MSQSQDHPVVTRIYSALQEAVDRPRPHLGASLIGHPCERYLWLSFRWAIAPKFSGRTRRLFRRGHNEESHVIKDLRDIGIKVFDKDPSTGAQFSISHGHFGGSLDGVIQSGAPHITDNIGYVLEIKTHSEKSFNDVQKNGVAKSKPQHWAQMQCYMHSSGITKALYFAVCKNDDRLYVEIIDHDLEEAKKLFFKAQRITAADRLPEPLSTDPTWYQCKMCDFHDFCHGSKIAQQINCRTCSQVTPKPDGTWHCQRWNDSIPDMDAQLSGCEDHVIHPDLVPWPMTPCDDGLSVKYTIKDETYLNGHEGWSSRKLFEHYNMVINPHPLVEAITKAFPDAQIVQKETE